MKKLIFTAILLGGLFSLFAEEKPVQKLSLSNGIPVYYINNTENEIDAVCISVEGSINYLTPETSGLENVLFQLMTTGSGKYSKDYLDTWNYRTSASISAGTDYYCSSLNLNCIDKYLDESLDILCDCFINPKLASDEYEKIITSDKQRIQSQMNDPVTIAAYYAAKIIYENHPYSVFPNTTIDSIGNITLAAVKNHFKSILDSRRIKIYAVTKQSGEQLVSKLNSTIGKIGAQSYKLIQKEVTVPVVNEKPIIVPHQNAAGSGYLLRFVAGPALGTDEYITMKLAQTIYSKILYNVVRGKYGACYSIWMEQSGGKACICEEVIYQCSDIENVKTYLEEARQLMSEGKYITGTKKDGSFEFSDFDSILEGVKNSIINSTYSSQATTLGLLNRMKNCITVYGTTDEIDRQYQQIKNTTSEEIIDVFNKYIPSEQDFWIGVVGPEDEERTEEMLEK